MGERIAFVGNGSAVAARRVIDAQGLVVSPGFIDVHSHSIEEAFKSPKRLNEGVVRMGVTTIVGGPDGYFAPFHMRMILDSLKHHGSGTNVAMYIGHNGVREALAVFQNYRLPTGKELAPGVQSAASQLPSGDASAAQGAVKKPA